MYLTASADNEGWRVIVKDFKKSPSFSLSSSDDLTHVEVTSVKEESGEEVFSIASVSVSPSLYPSADVKFSQMLRNQNGEFWGITQIGNQTVTFFKKVNTFGDYWVCANVNASRTIAERVQEKIAKGYSSLNSEWLFRASEKDVIRLI